MPRKLPFDVAVGSLRQLVEGMVPGEELVLTVQGEPKAVVTKPVLTSWPCRARHGEGHDALDGPDFDAPLEDFATIESPCCWPNNREETEPCPQRSQSKRPKPNSRS